MQETPKVGWPLMVMTTTKEKNGGRIGSAVLAVLVLRRQSPLCFK